MSADEFDPYVERLFARTPHMADAPLFAAGVEAKLATGSRVRTLALSLLVLGLWSLIGLGAGILIPNQVAAILIAVGAAWIVDPLAAFGLSFASWGQPIVSYLPSSATSAMVGQINGNANVELLSWWAGALVLVAYAAVLSGIGSLLTVRRDVT